MTTQRKMIRKSISPRDGLDSPHDQGRGSSAEGPRHGRAPGVGFLVRSEVSGQRVT